MRMWVLVTAVALAACGAKDEKKYAPAVGEREVVGKVVRVDDASAAQFFVHVVALGHASELLLRLDAARADLGGRSPTAFAGQNATVTYVTDRAHSLADVRIDDSSVLAQDSPLVSVVGMSEVTGVLGGADETHADDTPDEITVTDAAGHVTTFATFVTDSLTEANGALVTAFYDEVAQHRVTSIRPLTN